MKDLYNEHYYAQQASSYAFDEERRQVFDYHLKNILSLKNGITSVLDLGCGFGYFLKLCERVGIKDVCGLEISDYAIEQAERHTKADIRKVDNLRTAFGDKKFEAVTAFDVVEHLENDREVFRFVYERLWPGGLFYGTTPNANWFLAAICGEKDPTHINVQSRAYWFNLLKDMGFRDVSVQWILLFGFPPDQALRQRLGITHIKPVFTSIEFLGQEILFSARK